MGIRAMKFDLFVLKALEKKGYTLEALMELSEEELDGLNLPDKIISQVKEYKIRGGKTPSDVAEELAALMEADSETNMTEEEVKVVYENKSTFTIEVPDIQTEAEAKEYIERVKDNIAEREVKIISDDASITIEADGNVKIEAENITVSSTDELEVVRTIAKAEDLDIIKESLKNKELRSFAAYTKHLKSEVPAAVLEAVESTTINTLIDERIAEVKASSTK